MGKYIVRIESDGISNLKFLTDINARNAEIKRCTNVRTIKTCRVFAKLELQKKIHYILLETDNKEDFNKLTAKWTCRAFESDSPVYTTTEYIDVELTVENVDKRIDLDKNDQCTKNLIDNGVYVINRAYRKDRATGSDGKIQFKETPINKLTMKMCDLESLKKVLIDGIDLEWTCSNHTVKPKFRKAFICNKCCQYDHFTNGCKNNPVCGACSEKHLTIECRNPNKKCYWCKSSNHSAGSDACIKNYQINYELNKYIVDFMLGEGISKTVSEALGIKQADGIAGNDILVNEDNIIDNNSYIREQIQEQWQVASDEMRGEIERLKVRINNSDNRITHVSEEVIKLDKKYSSEIREVIAKVESNHEKTNNRLNLLQEEINKKHDESKQQMANLESNLSSKLALILDKIK